MRSWTCCGTSDWRRSTARSTCTSRASAPRSRTIRRSRAASSRSAAPATSSPRRRIEPQDRKTRPMRRLYQKIYLTIIASLLLVVLVAGAAWRLGGDRMPVAQAFEMAGEIAAAALPPADAPQDVQERAVRRLARTLRIDLALFDSSLHQVAAFGRPLPPPTGFSAGGWLYGPGGPAWSFRLPDQRWIV